jgi:hypothetical protein
MDFVLTIFYAYLKGGKLMKRKRIIELIKVLCLLACSDFFTIAGGDKATAQVQNLLGSGYRL